MLLCNRIGILLRNPQKEVMTLELFWHNQEAMPLL